MKKITLLAILFLSITAFGQKKEKIKGSKIVTIEQKEIGSFNQIEAFDNLEISVVKGEKPSIEIEADDNLHEFIGVEQQGTSLVITTLKEISGAKKLHVRITYTNSLSMISVKNDAVLTALAEINLNELTLKSYDNSKIYANASVNNFTLLAQDKTKIELNLKAHDAVIEGSKNTQIKALVASEKIQIDLYQRSQANVEGDAEFLRVRVDNNSQLTAKNLTASQVSVVAEGNSKSAIYSKNKLTLETSGKSETHIYGDAKIVINKFGDESSIHKKNLK